MMPFLVDTQLTLQRSTAVATADRDQPLCCCTGMQPPQQRPLQQ